MHVQCGRPGFDPWVGKIPWRRERLSTPVFWPGEFHGLHSPWGRKESDTTEQPSLSLSQWRKGAMTKESLIDELGELSFLPESCSLSMDSDFPWCKMDDSFCPFLFHR